MRKTLSLTCLCLFLFHPNIYAQDSSSKAKPLEIPIKDAIAKGIVHVTILGAYDTRQHNVIDNEGLHYGKCMAAIIQADNVDSFVAIKLECGTLLIPDDSFLQTMVVTNDVLFPLGKGYDYDARFYAMCAQLHDRPPFRGARFQIGEKADSSLFKLAHYIEKSHMQNIVGQYSVWAYTDNAVFDTLKIYGADSFSLAQTIGVLDAVNIKTKLNQQPLAPQKNENLMIQINRYYVYGGIGLIALLGFASIFLFTKRSVRNET